MSLIKLAKQKRSIEIEMQAMRDKYNDEVGLLNIAIKKEMESLRIANSGLNSEMVSRGMSIISFGTSEPWDGSERHNCVMDAIKDAAEGFPRLSERYFGTKCYDQWVDQREDHKYGYGPRHGYISFRVGLTEEARKIIEADGQLPERDLECALYCLMNMDVINSAKWEAS